jgi:hypothetical protein
MAVAKKATEPEVEAPVEVVPESLNIYQRISLISKEAGALEAKKGGSGVPFPFRGIDSTINHLSPYLQKYGVIFVPTVVQHQVEHVDDGKRTVTWSDVVTSYTFYAPDGSNVVATTPGIAMDYADRSTAQAMSVSLRIALLQTFGLPTQTKEPEETGQETLAGASSASGPTRAQAQIAKAKEPEVDPLDKARLDVRKAGAAKGLSPSQINEVGQKIDPDFFSKVDALVKVKEAIEAKSE